MAPPSPPLVKIVTVLIAMLPNVLARRGGSISETGDLIEAIFGLPARSGLTLIFGVATFIQAMFTLRNLYRRVGRPPVTKKEEFSLGPMFPLFLLLSSVFLTAYYILHAIFVFSLDDYGVSILGLSQMFFDAKAAAGVLGDVFLASALLSLILHRAKVLLGSSGKWRLIKMIIDVLLVLTLLSLGMGFSWLLNGRDPERKFIELERLIWAYDSLFLLAVVDIMVSSVVLWVSMGKRPTTVNDHKMTLCIAFVISPFFLLYAIFPIIESGLIVQEKRPGTQEQWELAGLAIAGVIEFWIITVCLFFGFPLPAKIAKALGSESRA